MTGADSDECAAAVAAEIGRLLREATVRDKQTGIARGARPGDVGILFRSRASHREFESALEAAGIPTYVYKGLGFFDADEIKDLSGLIRFLANPSSELRAAAFLRSRFVRLSDTALAMLAPGLAAALTAAAPPPALVILPDDDRAALEQARRHVPRWLACVDRVPPADLVEQLLPVTAYAYELRGGRRQQAWENVKKMRGLIRRIQNRGYATLARIADHLDSLTAGDESSAVLEALDAVNLMTVHASKGLEFPIVFVVNLAKGASGFPRPVRVSGEDVSVGPFVSDSDEEERVREREETKRLMYVALTRARDRLYLGTVLKDGEVARGRGSLADVLPESVRALFVRAAQEPGDSVGWTAQSGREYRFRLARAVAPSEPVASAPSLPVASAPSLSVASAFRRKEAPAAALPPEGGRHGISGSRPNDTRDFFEPLVDPAAIERMPVTQALDQAGPASAASPFGRDEDDALVGTLVHRLVQFAAELAEFADSDDVANLAARLMRPEERATAVDAAASVARAIAAWSALRAQPGLAELLASGERMHEVPFSCVAPESPARVLRGTIDCLVRRPDGSIAVIEFKTGAPSKAHQAQLDIYLQAARAMFPDSPVTGRIAYAGG